MKLHVKKANKLVKALFCIYLSHIYITLHVFGIILCNF